MSHIRSQYYEKLGIDPRVDPIVSEILTDIDYATHNEVNFDKLINCAVKRCAKKAEDAGNARHLYGKRWYQHVSHTGNVHDMFVKLIEKLKGYTTAEERQALEKEFQDRYGGGRGDLYHD